MTDVDTVVAPEDIDVGFVPRLTPGLVAMDVGAETVLLGEFGHALVLNPTAGLVWRFLDGETALADLIDDFSEVLDVDADRVRSDIVDFVRSLGRSGLLEGVAETFEAGDLAEIDWSRPEPVGVGEVLEPLILTDLDAAPATLGAGPAGLPGQLEPGVWVLHNHRRRTGGRRGRAGCGGHRSRPPDHGRPG